VADACECGNEFGFREMRGISLLVAKRLASQEGLCIME